MLEFILIVGVLALIFRRPRMGFFGGPFMGGFGRGFRRYPPMGGFHHGPHGFGGFHHGPGGFHHGPHGRF